MTWTITERFPSWGETGEFPADGFFYEGGDQVNEKHLDALWNGVDVLEGEVRSALQDIDSDEDGVVDKADALATAATLDGDLSAVDGEVIWDESASHIPNARLETTSLTVSGGDGLKDGGSVSLGGTTTLNIEPADFAGAGVQDDGSDNLELVNDSVTVNAGNQLTGGGTVNLGSSITINLNEGSGSGLDADTVDGQDAGDITTIRDVYTKSQDNVDPATDVSFTNGIFHYGFITAGNGESSSITIYYDDGTNTSFSVSDTDSVEINEVQGNKNGQYVTRVIASSSSSFEDIDLAVADIR
jgi:hypothetical protein